MSGKDDKNITQDIDSTETVEVVTETIEKNNTTKNDEVSATPSNDENLSESRTEENLNTTQNSDDDKITAGKIRYCGLFR